MVLESTMICFDNSDYQRNGDYVPTRLNVQKDGVNLVCLTKVRSNPENNVGLMTIANTVEVLVTLTSDIGRIFTKLQTVQPKGEIQLLTGIRIAHLVLKHRLGKNHKMRIVVFVGSPIKAEEGDLVKLAKRLKKEKVNVDIVEFGGHEHNFELLSAFISALNGKDGTGSHFLSVPRGSVFSDALLSSPIIQGEDGMGGAGLCGTGFEFGVDPNEDPELALALRVSMEEQRQRQEDEQRRALADSNASSGAGGGGDADTGTALSAMDEQNSEEAMLRRALADSNASSGTGGGGDADTAIGKTAEKTGTALSAIDEQNSEEAMLQRALAMSSEVDDDIPDIANMTEDEQLAYAVQMSVEDSAEETIQQQSKRPRTDDNAMNIGDDFSDLFLQNALANLPGVDPQSDAVRDAIESLSKDKKKESGDSDKK